MRYTVKVEWEQENGSLAAGELGQNRVRFVSLRR